MSMMMSKKVPYLRGVLAAAMLASALLAVASAEVMPVESRSAAGARAIQPFTAEYLASYMGLQGNGRMVLAPSGDNLWRYSLDIRSPMASLNQTTVFEARNGEWRPVSNTDSAEVLVKRRKRDATYDWDKGEARWTGDVKPERAGPVKLQAGDLDAMLVNLAIAHDLAAGRPLRYRMVDDGRIRHLHFRVAGKETITVGGEPRQATKVVRTDGDKQEVLWVVAGLPVPARILRRKDGHDEMDLRLKALH